jgi:phage terminase small subunit
MFKHSNQTAPEHLASSTRAWFDHIVSTFELESHHIRLLTLAGEAWDRCQEARARLAAEGLTVSGREGLKTHPCIAIERDARAAFASLVKQLGLDDVGDPRRGPGRPAHGFGVTYRQLQGLPEPAKPGRRQRRTR